MKKFLLATMSLVAITSVTRAADMPATMPAKGPMYLSVPVATWDGFYVGVQGGIVRRKAALEQNGGLNGPFSDTNDKNGGAGGGILGYNWQAGNFIYGVEGDWNWLKVNSSRATPGVTSNSSDINWIATARGRVGLTLDSILIYISGGTAFGQVKNDFSVLVGATTIPAFSFIQDQTKFGWTVGGGIEHMFARHWTARAEFRYVDLGKSAVTCTTGVDTCPTGYRSEFSNKLLLGLFGLAYKF